MKWLLAILIALVGVDVLYLALPAAPRAEVNEEGTTWTQDKKDIVLSYWFDHHGFRASLKAIYPSSKLTRVDEDMIEEVVSPHFILKDTPERTTSLDADSGQFNWRTSVLYIDCVRLERTVAGIKTLEATAKGVLINLRKDTPEITAYGIVGRRIS